MKTFFISLILLIIAYNLCIAKPPKITKPMNELGINFEMKPEQMIKIFQKKSFSIVNDTVIDKIHTVYLKNTKKMKVLNNVPIFVNLISRNDSILFITFGYYKNNFNMNYFEKNPAINIIDMQERNYNPDFEEYFVATYLDTWLYFQSYSDKNKIEISFIKPSLSK